MILVLIAILAVGGLGALFKSQSPNKIKFMSYIVILLVVVNFVNELINSLRYVNTFEEIKGIKPYTFERELYKLPGQKVLLKEEQLVVDYLGQRMRAGEHVVISIRNLHPQRFRIVFAEYQRLNDNVRAIELDQKHDGPIDSYSLRKAISKQSHFPYVILENYFEFEQLTLIKALYQSCAVTFILRTIPQGFLRHSLSQYTQIVQLPQSYFMSQLYRSYPSNLITLCSKYVPINYNFYVRSQTQPLSQLCCSGLPSTPVTECVRKEMRDETEMVPLSRVAGCLDGGATTEGLLIQNGMVRVRKEYYWSGRCDVSQFTQQHMPHQHTDNL